MKHPVINFRFCIAIVRSSKGKFQCHLFGCMNSSVMLDKLTSLYDPNQQMSYEIHEDPVAAVQRHRELESLSSRLMEYEIRTSGFCQFKTEAENSNVRQLNPNHLAMIA